MTHYYRQALFAAFFCIAVFFLADCRTMPDSSGSTGSTGAGGTAVNSFPYAMSGSNDTGDAPVTPSASTNGGGTLLAIPPREQLKKNSLDESILGYLETGSPDSIKLAIERINSDPRGMTEENRVALAVSAELIKIVYPLEKVTWSAPSVPDSNLYLAAIRSARMGVYDYNTGANDFFALVLPSLVLYISTAPGNYYSDAEAALTRAASMHPSSVLPPLFLALLSERQGKKDESASFYKKAWELDSSCYPAGMGYASALTASHNGKAALQIARQLLGRYPDSIRMVKLAAEASFSDSDWNTADPLVLQVLKNEPGNTAYLLMRAQILVERKDYLKANSLLDAFATTNRTDKLYLLLRARVLREWNKNPGAAVTILQDAQTRYPSDVEVLLASAEVCYQTGLTINRLGGRDFVQTILQTEPENEKALYLLASDYIKATEWASAVKTATRLEAVYPGDASQILLASAYIGSGQNQAALSLVQPMYQAGKPTDEITSLYLQSLIGSGLSAQASAVIKARLPESEAPLKSILYYHESLLSSNPDTRLASLRSSLLADPRNIKSLYAMYDWYFERKDYRKAQYYLKQVIALEPSNKKWNKLLSALEELIAR